MKAVLNIAAAVLIAAGLVVAVASLLTPGQVILGIDFKLAATLVVGGLIVHALASALTLLERMSSDLRQLRKAGSEEPPWLRQSAAATAAAAYVAPAAAEALHEDVAEVEDEDEFGRDIDEEPEVTPEDRWPLAAETEAATAYEPETPEPAAPEHEAGWQLPSAPLPVLEPEPQSSQAEVTAETPGDDEAEARSELDIEFEPTDAVTEEPADADQTEAESEPHPTEATVVGESEEPSLSEPSEDAVQAGMGSEPGPPVVEDQAATEPETSEDEPAGLTAVPSTLKPSQDMVAPEIVARAAEPSDVQEETVEEPGALYVVEERVVRGKQARVLSDGTIEAETAEGWMRFEDFDHLEEYLDAMAEMITQHKHGA